MGQFVDICRFSPLNTGTGQGTPTFSNGSAVINQTGHGYVANQPVFFTTSGTLPTNFSPLVPYYVIATGLTSNAFEVSATVGGAAIVAGSAGSGTHTANGGIQVGSAITGFCTPANAGCVDSTPGASTQKAYAYGIFDNGIVSETGICWFNSTQTMMVRAPLHSSPSGAAPVAYTTTAQIAITAITTTLQSPPNGLTGISMANNGGTPNTKMDIVAASSGGFAADASNSLTIALTGTVTVDCSTTGANGLDTGSLPTSGTVHFFVIYKLDGTVAGLGSTSVTPALPAGYFFYRRIGGDRTDGSAHLKAFVQDGDYFQWNAFAADVAAVNPGTAAVTRTLSVPTGVRVQAVVAVSFLTTTGNAIDNPGPILLTDLSISDQTPSVISALNFESYSALNGTITQGGGMVSVFTNTSGQIRSRVLQSTANLTLYINTLGWIDRRGRD